MLGDSLRRRNPRGRGVEKRRGSGGGGVPRGLTRWVPLVLAALAIPFFGGYLVASVFLFPAPEAAESGIPVPDLSGLPLAEAQALLRSNGLGSVEVMELPHPDAPEGVVTAQAPLPGQQLRPGKPVRVAISSGVPRVVVPDVIGFSADRAERLLSGLGFDVERQEQFSPVDSARVLRSHPAAGTEWPLPTMVTILVSLGPEFRDTIFAPDTLLPPMGTDTLMPPLRPDTLMPPVRVDTLGRVPSGAHAGRGGDGWPRVPGTLEVGR